MNYGNIIFFDTGNAKGLSTVLFVSGCTSNCFHCHNKELQDFDYGKLYTANTEEKIIKSILNPHIKNLVISGGEPLHWRNINTVTSLCKKIKYNRSDINVIIYTGYKVEIDILGAHIDYSYNIYNHNLFLYVDYLIDGAYKESMSTKKRELRGSYNQRCYNILHNQMGEVERIIDVTESYFK